MQQGFSKYHSYVDFKSGYTSLKTGCNLSADMARGCGPGARAPGSGQAPRAKGPGARGQGPRAKVKGLGPGASSSQSWRTNFAPLLPHFLPHFCPTFGIFVLFPGSGGNTVQKSQKTHGSSASRTYRKTLLPQILVSVFGRIWRGRIWYLEWTPL